MSEVVGVARGLHANTRTNVNDECNLYGLERGAHSTLLSRPGKRKRAVVSTTTVPIRESGALIPTIKILINAKKVLGLLDTGSPAVKSFSGKIVICNGATQVPIELNGVETKVEYLVGSKKIPGVDVIIGMDVLREDRVVMNRGVVPLSAVEQHVEKASLNIIGRNFSGAFNGKKCAIKWD
ncbi:unnamed protein product [Lepeophtheirus salmonis]|uniref:(salmon louse) hypothetical protein n=1 Tax=Lepeophtheirus salmonis TaxID=72036 RepID=A0A7R8HBG4_LEPSM|nr:unnamed protein product [Lepeophtheirus salmonis]CAF2980929.1 unnamed protein product [Lepeophtheirus salmonis]